MEANTNTKQKYQIGTKVSMCDDMRSKVILFERGVTAIVECTYRQYANSVGDAPDGYIDDYSLIMLDENDNPESTIAWVKGNLLSLVSSDVEKGKNIIKKYRNKKNVIPNP